MKSGRAEAIASQVEKLRKQGGRERKSALLLVLVLISLIVLNGCSGVVSGQQRQPSNTTSLQVSPASVDFGKVLAGQKTSQTFTLTNTGKAAVNIQQVSFSNSQFNMSGVTLPTALAPNQDLSFLVWLNGTSMGSVSGTLKVQGDAGSSPVRASLAGTVITSQPQLSVSSAALNLGTVSIGSKGTASLVLSNAGSTDLTVSMVSLTGAEFGITGITTPKVISSGQKVPVTVTFSPTGAGSTSGSITITSNDSANPTTTVTLSGTGTSSAIGQLSTNPTSWSFGNVANGSTSSKQVILSNIGTAPVRVSSISVTGNGFSVNGVTTPATINPSASVTLEVDFSPKATGSVTGSVTLVSDANGSPLSVALSGTGVQAGLSVSPSSFSFGNVVDGQTKSQVFTVTNTGSASLTISQLSVSGAAYSVSGMGTPAMLAAGQSTTFNAQFAPTTAGVLSGMVSIVSSAPNSPASVALSGTGSATSVTMSASPSNVSFGNIAAGSAGSKSVTITNSGNSSLTISQIAVSAKDVSVSGITTPFTLGAGNSAAMNLTFAPNSAESVTGNVTISSSQGLSAVVSVTGAGVQAALTTTPTSVSFGNVPVGTSNSQTIRLSNTGNAVLTITQLSVTGSGFSTGALSLPISLNPGSSTNINVAYQPGTAGAVAGSVSVVSNASNSPDAIALSGTGITATQSLNYNPTSVTFGSVNTGSSSTKNVAVTNAGNSNVNISQISVSGAGYSLSGVNTPVTLTPTQGLTFNVIFSPSTTGSASGAVSVTSNAAGSPATIALSGTGAQATLHTIALNWNTSTSTVSGYNVYRSTTSGSGYSRLNGALVGSLNYTDATVQNGTTYYYVTTAVDANSVESTYSNEAQAIIP